MLTRPNCFEIWLHLPTRQITRKVCYISKERCLEGKGVCWWVWRGLGAALVSRRICQNKTLLIFIIIAVGLRRSIGKHLTINFRQIHDHSAFLSWQFCSGTYLKDWMHWAPLISSECLCISMWSYQEQIHFGGLNPGAPPKYAHGFGSEIDAQIWMKTESHNNVCTLYGVCIEQLTTVFNNKGSYCRPPPLARFWTGTVLYSRIYIAPLNSYRQTEALWFD